MYLKSFKIENIRCIDSLSWEVPDGREAGWHVILGDNGAGKSTLLRAVALAFVGHEEAQALREDWNVWLASDKNQGSIRLSVSRDNELDRWGGGPSKSKSVKAGLEFSRGDDHKVKMVKQTVSPTPERHVWSDLGGWFSASYGPFRRFSGGNKDTEKLFYSHPKLARHLSVFSEDVALTEALEWLKDLKFKALEENSHEAQLLELIKRFVNQDGFLPHEAKLSEVTSDGVVFTDGNGHDIPVPNLSDGYRSILSFTFELIRQLSMVYESDDIFDANCATRILAPGVVLVDEIDAHLHPTWQRRIGKWLRGHFPNMQFIVTTHSPLICQAAEDGSVWRLPTPGSGEVGGFITGVELRRLVYGNALEAYGTGAFGTNVGRSDSAEVKLQRLAQLNNKELDEGLSKEEDEEREDLEAIFGLNPGVME